MILSGKKSSLKFIKPYKGYYTTIKINLQHIYGGKNKMSKIVLPTDGTYKTVKKMLSELCEKYPFLKLSSIGKSVLGKDIFTVEIGKSHDKILYVGGVHGTEWLTSLLLLKFIEELSEGYEHALKIADIDVRAALYGRGIIILPMLNPDGIDISICGSSAAGANLKLTHEITHGDYSGWNANANGIDLNHNFDAGFDILKRLERESGIFGPAKGKYGGEKPESEPETKAACDLCRKNKIRCLLTFHSQGEEIYWKYGENEPKNSKLIANVLALSSGYRLASPEGTASHGGMKDWFINEFVRPGYTIEIGKGKNPLPIEMLGEIYDKLTEMFMLSVVL